jgi:hypothetical protein
MKCDYNEAKTYCSVSLLSLLLKKMQKSADRHIKDIVMKDILCIKTNLPIKLESCTSQSGGTHCEVQLKKKLPQGSSLTQELLTEPTLRQ